MEFNQAKLKSIVNASETATAAMMLFAGRERKRHSINLEGIKKQLKDSNETVVESDYEALWNALEAAGVGSIVRGRRGNPDRFEWNYSLKDIAQAALEDKPIVPETLEAKPVVAVKPAAYKLRKRIALAPVEAAKVVYSIPLKQGSIEITLPAGMTNKQVTRILDSLRK